MKEQLNNILWMSEQLDFNGLSEQSIEQITVEINDFLDSAANRKLAHSVYPAQR